ncbi:hypothetical protein CBR_g51416 [Chara braunii]|uniref:CCHC-type domain-containing protein n=1 Tax=Chara braunii TaxID=69332 RepID=A0A388M8W7_CHABU|nr:hypothetical protein CBR_g51416 [Chara braunii]|eukprot:GBG90909.1 hypothetical protein CBR_g51416 [Chara braunii]
MEWPRGGGWNGSGPGWNDGGAGWNGGGPGGGNWGGGGGRRNVKCYNCGQCGNYSRDCMMPRQGGGGGYQQGNGQPQGGAPGQGWNGAGSGSVATGNEGGGGASALVVKLSTELEESFGAMASFFKLSLEEKAKANAAKKEEEERLKREEFERVAKEEAKRIELEKKGEEEKKEADRNWSIRKLFSEQPVFLRKEVKSAVNEELHEMVKQEDSDLPKVEGHATFKLSTLRNVPDAFKNAKDSIRKVGRDLAKEVFMKVNDALLKFGLDGSIKPGDVWKAVRMEGNGGRGYTDNAVERWRRLLVNFVRVPLDKNPAESLVMCAKVYADGMRDMFWGKKSFYVVGGSEEDVLAECKGTYEEGGFNSLGKWDGKGRLGHGYILLKNKDIGRFRPITPSYSEPSKQAGQRVTGALNGMITLLPPSGHFNLKSTGGLKRRVEEITRWALAKGEGGTIKGLSFDVKEMFNELPHASILKVVEWLRGRMKKKKREGVYVKKKGKGVSFANQRDKDWLFVSVDQVMDYVKYE